MGAHHRWTAEEEEVLLKFRRREAVDTNIRAEADQVARLCPELRG